MIQKLNFTLYVPRRKVLQMSCCGKVFSTKDSDAKKFIKNAFVIRHDNGLTEGRCFESGRRSCVLAAENNGIEKFFSVKGCARIVKTKNDDYGDEPENATNYQSSLLERKGIEEYNKLMYKEGITPLQEYAGFIEYPEKWKNQRVVATIKEVKGDTRLDEILRAFIFLNLYCNCVSEKSSGYSRKFVKEVKELNKESFNIAYNLGLWAGFVKKLFSDKGFTWSRKYDGSVIDGYNAHTGNFVLYENSPNKTIVGMTDFDAVYLDLKKNSSIFKKILEWEYYKLCSGMMYCEFSSGFSAIDCPYTILKLVDEKSSDFCTSGFKKGYSTNKQPKELPTKDVFEIINFIKKNINVDLKNVGGVELYWFVDHLKNMNYISRILNNNKKT